jgi:hypothetical protein
MTEREMSAKLAELDQLLNDPETRMDAQRVWALLAELREHVAKASASVFAAIGGRAV